MKIDFFDADAEPVIRKEIEVSDYENVEIPFGKHKYSSLLEVAESDPGYLSWMESAYKADSFNHPWVGENVHLFHGVRVAVAQKAIAAAPELTLTPHQTEVTDQVLRFALEECLPIVRLQGGAGYGKSYATERLVRELTLAGYLVRAMAVSYVATEVLRQQLDHLKVQCGTVARTLRFNKRWDAVTGVEKYEFSPETDAEAAALLSKRNALIVDEASMCGDDIAVLLFNAVNANGGLLVLVGDEHQLPPVKQETKSLFCADWPTGVATLSKPMRYNEDSALYGVEQIVRNNPWAVFNLLDENPAGEVTVVRSMKEMIATYADLYRADPAALHRMLLFRRAEVTTANKAIREALFGTDAGDVVEDEKLMVLSTSDFPYRENEEEKSDCTRWYSGESFRVVAMEEDVYQIEINGVTYEIPHYVARFQDRQVRARIMFSVSEHAPDKSRLGGLEMGSALVAARAWGKHVQEQKDMGLMPRNVDGWAPFKRLSGDFVKVGYQYATSVHRAQGQTCDYAYAAPRTLLSVRGIAGKALAYVAMTRARKHLTVLV